jgi:AAA ATPase containing von Willebrand factor type A (vWA) domain
MSKPKFQAKNSENIDSKPEGVQRLWRILSKMDPEGTLFVNDAGIIGFEGDVPQDRTPKALGFKPDETKLLRPWAILDGPVADDPETASGVLFTTYQLIELAYELGKRDEHASTTEALTSAAEDEEEDEEEEDEEFDPDDEEGDDEDEDFDEEEDEDLDVLDEDEYDDEDDEDD